MAQISFPTWILIDGFIDFTRKLSRFFPAVEVFKPSYLHNCLSGFFSLFGLSGYVVGQRGTKKTKQTRETKPTK